MLVHIVVTMKQLLRICRLLIYDVNLVFLLFWTVEELKYNKVCEYNECKKQPLFIVVQ